MSARNEDDDNWGVEDEDGSSNNNTNNQGNTTNKNYNDHCGSTPSSNSNSNTAVSPPQSHSYLTLAGAQHQPLTDVVSSASAIATAISSSSGGGQQGAAGFKVPPPPRSAVLSSSHQPHLLASPLSSATHASSCGTSSSPHDGHQKSPINNAPKHRLPEGERDEDYNERKVILASHTSSAHTAVVSPPPPPQQQHSTSSSSASPKQFKLPPPPPLPVMTTPTTRTSFSSPKSSAATTSPTMITTSRTVVLPPPDLRGHVGVHVAYVGVGGVVEKERGERGVAISSNATTIDALVPSTGTAAAATVLASSPSPRYGPGHPSPPMQQTHQQQLVGPRVVTIATIDAPLPSQKPNAFTTAAPTASTASTIASSSSPNGKSLSSSHSPPPPPVAPQTLLLPKDYAVEYRQALRRLYLGYIATHWELSWGKGKGKKEGPSTLPPSPSDNFRTPSTSSSKSTKSSVSLSEAVGKTVVRVDVLSNLVAHGMPRLEDLAKIEIHQLKNKERERAAERHQGEEGHKASAVSPKVGTHQTARDDEEQLKILENILKTLVEAKKAFPNGGGGDAVSSSSNSQQQQQRTMKRVAFIKALCAEFSLDATTGGTAQTNAAVRAAAKGNHQKQQQQQQQLSTHYDIHHDDDDEDAYEQMLRLFHSSTATKTSSSASTTETAASGRPPRVERCAADDDDDDDGLLHVLFFDAEIEHERFDAVFPRLFPKPFLEEELVSALGLAEAMVSAAVHLLSSSSSSLLRQEEKEADVGEKKQKNTLHSKSKQSSSFVLARHIVNALWQAIRLFAHVLHWIPFFVKEEGEKRKQEEKESAKRGEVEDFLSHQTQKMGDKKAALAASKRERTVHLMLDMRLRCAQGVLQSSQLLLWGKSGRDEVHGDGGVCATTPREARRGEEDVVKTNEGLRLPRSDLDDFSKLEESIAAASMALQQAVPSSAAHWTERQASSLAHNLLKYTKHHHHHKDWQCRYDSLTASRTTAVVKKDSSSFLDFFQINPLAYVLLGVGGGDVSESKHGESNSNVMLSDGRQGVSLASLSLSEWTSVCSQTNAIFASHVSTTAVSTRAARATASGGGSAGAATTSSSSLISAAFATRNDASSSSSSTFLPVPFTAPTPLPLMTLLLLSAAATSGLELAKSFCYSQSGTGDVNRASGGSEGSAASASACLLLGELMLEGLSSHRVSDTDDALLVALQLLAAGAEVGSAHVNDVINSDIYNNSGSSNANKMINASAAISFSAHQVATYRSATGALRVESDALLSQLKSLGFICASNPTSMSMKRTTTAEEKRRSFCASCVGTMVVPRLFQLLNNLFEEGERRDSISLELSSSSSPSSSFLFSLLRLKMVGHMVDRCGVQAWSQLAHLTEIEEEEENQRTSTAASNESGNDGDEDVKSEKEAFVPSFSSSSSSLALKPSKAMACIIRHWYTEWSDLLHKLGISCSTKTGEGEGVLRQQSDCHGHSLSLLMRRIVKLATLSSPYYSHAANAAESNGTPPTPSANTNTNNNAAVSKFLAEAQDILRAIDERVKVLTAVAGLGLGGASAITQTTRQASQHQYEQGQEGAITNNEGELSLLAKAKALILGLVGECDVSSGLKLNGAVVRVSALAKYVSLFIRREEEEKANRQRHHQRSRQQQQQQQNYTTNSSGRNQGGEQSSSSPNNSNNRDYFYYRRHREQIQASVGLLTSDITPATADSSSVPTYSSWMLRILAASPAGDGQLLHLLAQPETCLLNTELLSSTTTSAAIHTENNTFATPENDITPRGEKVLLYNSDYPHLCRQWLSKTKTTTTVASSSCSSSFVAPPSHGLRCQSHLNIAATLETVLLHSKTILHHHHHRSMATTGGTPTTMTVGHDVVVADGDHDNHYSGTHDAYTTKEIASATALLNPSEMCILVLEHLRNALSCAYHPAHTSDLNNKNKSSSLLLAVDKVLELRVRLIRARTLYNLRKFMGQQQQRHQHHHQHNPHQINATNTVATTSTVTSGGGGATLIPAAVLSGASAAYSYYYLNHYRSSSSSAGSPLSPEYNNQEEVIIAEFESAAAGTGAVGVPTTTTAAALLSPAFAAANEKLRQILLRSLTSSVSSSSSKSPLGVGGVSAAAVIAAEAAVAGKGAPIIAYPDTTLTSPSSSLITLDDALAREMQWLESSSSSSGGGLNVVSSSMMSSMTAAAHATATSSSSSSGDDEDDDVDSVNESDPRGTRKRGEGHQRSSRRRRDEEGGVGSGNDGLLSSTRSLLNVLECAAAALASSASSSSSQGQRTEPPTNKIGSKRLREETDELQQETEGERVHINIGISIGIVNSIGTYLSYALLKAHVLLDEQSGGTGDYLSAEALARAVLKVATVAVDGVRAITLWAAPFIVEGCRLLAACITIAKGGQGEVPRSDTDDVGSDNATPTAPLPHPSLPSSTVTNYPLCSILRNLHASNKPRFLMKVAVTVSSLAGLSRSEHQSLHWALTNELGDHDDVANNNIRAGSDADGAERESTRKKTRKEDEGGGENEKYLATITPAAWGAAQTRYDQQVRAVFTGVGGASKSGGGGGGSNSFASLPAALDRLAAHLPGLVADY